MSTRKRTGVIRAAVIVALAAMTVSCGAGDAEPAGAGTSTSPSPTDSAASPSRPGGPGSRTPSGRTRDPSGTTITSASSDFGEVLWGPNRQVVYIWESEPTDRAECYGECAEAWPPVLTSGAPAAAGKVDETLLGTTTRTDGSTQVTYNGHPLYYYAHEGPGEVKCHNIATHGGLWWVVTPAGDRAA